ncbi:GNAT family N-acetyltransferase [Mameliella sediminis]|uniref:GNAT family N-acetyltransferase n=1 Tax=Mameliella sediminis TaxID=2836866 RepID=UPI001C45846A|nr:GNAT family N-acetyltransferase [Mameliella sediminis]MBY6115790.1 GNAT family N-acetyltransferase [Antarctobacter heliothermus]MBY6145432.1 GNAT family N-acetyltransferase [Mameliella alba]MBV7393844.1 GNAT family N-acetyltransferase [Mameliella sediminis]MBY6162243.1 GNAT family N-acetyltransferase [Mameliella alba]MBY6170712.1 GNAT family N-acetyltransferase [Mameliella alba]
MSFVVRSAVPEDAQAICAIWNAVIETSAATFTTQLKTVEGIRGDIAARGDAFQVAEDAGALLGFATYFQFRGGPGYRFTMEHSIQLAPGARGRGAGRALMARLEEVARQADVHSLWAGVSGENPDGIAFHARLGFVEVARLPQVGHKFGRWMDLVLMQKILEPLLTENR